jgi:DNA primase
MNKSKAGQRTLKNLPIAISHPDNVFWPEEGYTKLDLAEYYEAIFPRLALYVKDRMLSLERCPDGMRGECFYQKQKPKGMPQGTPTRRIAHASGIHRRYQKVRACPAFA